MAYRMGIAEIINKATLIKDKQERAFFIRQHRTPQLEMILQYALDPRIKWLLPPGEYPFKRGPGNDLHSILYAECKKLYLYVEGGHPDLTTKKRFLLFLEFLERLNGEDAELMIKVKDQNLPKEINAEVVNLAVLPWWPEGLIQTPKEEPKRLPGRPAKPKEDQTLKVKKKPGRKPKPKADKSPMALSPTVFAREIDLTDSDAVKEALKAEEALEALNGQDAQIT